MRLLWLALAMSAFITFSADAKIIQSTAGSSVVWDVTVERIRVESQNLANRKFSKVFLEGIEEHGGVYYKPGEPELPVVRIWVAGPGPIRIESEGVSNLRQVLSAPIVPNLPSREKRRGKNTAFVFSKATYETSGYLPELTHRIEKVGSVHGQDQWLVTLFPLQYSPATGRIRLHSHFRVTAPSTVQIPSSMEPSGLIVVAGSAFSQSAALRQWVQWKRKLGFVTTIIEVTKDLFSPEAIRAKLMELYKQKAFHYVLLVGDMADVPGFDSLRVDGVTDHYYACLDNEDYDADIGTPDVGVGRLSVVSDEELEVVLGKWMRYEKGVFASDDWLTRISLIGTDDEENYQIAEASFQYLLEQYTKRLGYWGTFPGSPEPGGDKLWAISHKASSVDVLSRLQEGRGFINYGGHGLPTYWEGPQIKDFDVLALKDSGTLPVVISNSCDTGKYIEDRCFAETWLRHPHGAVMYLGSMEATYWEEDDVFQRRFYDKIYGEGSPRFSDFIHEGLKAVWTHYGGAGFSQFYWETYVLFGDPTMMFRTWRTRPVRLLPKSRFGGRTLYQVRDHGEVPVALAKVSVLRENEVVPETLVTDSDGLVWISDAKGKQSLTVSGKNLRALETELFSNR